ncbi:MAG: hypothetical protein LQ350_000388 [Teloschistes chrysophthalmus]|nr:MAG: hypothetical protein LQ350_000388 [Niorma chrysophthalma]
MSCRVVLRLAMYIKSSLARFLARNPQSINTPDVREPSEQEPRAQWSQQALLVYRNRPSPVFDLVNSTTLVIIGSKWKTSKYQDLRFGIAAGVAKKRRTGATTLAMGAPTVDAKVATITFSGDTGTRTCHGRAGGADDQASSYANAVKPACVVELLQVEMGSGG